MQFHPALSGQDTPRVGAIYPTGNNQHAIEALYLWVRQNYPDANAAFWQSRAAATGINGSIPSWHLSLHAMISLPMNSNIRA
ncbi:hypothetical protein [Shewanella khirikhana]|uniref:hypothetical protein n=1 Tax=Shewanella khirikhana TaxID=1965282 RepID=UPI001F333371|nr:hypothetical protein [Shewanella khirikhana]